jgi:hypothetical protein
MIVRPAGQQLDGTVSLGLAARGGIGQQTVIPAFTPSDIAQSVDLPALLGAPRPVIAQKVKRIKSAIAPDDSGSMYASFGDPTGIRYAAAKSIVKWMRKQGGGRVGVVHWGTDVGQVLAPVDVRRERRALDRTLQIPPTLGGNNLPAAIRKATDVLLPLDADDVPVVLIITDA